MTALSVGTLDGKQHQERVAVLHALPTRIATHSSNFQSQRMETIMRPSMPATSKSQAARQSGPVLNGNAAPQDGAPFLDQAPSESHLVSNGDVPHQSLPKIMQPAAATDLGTASPHDQPVPGSGPLQHPVTNGGLPEGKPQDVSLPPPLIDMERTKTDFFTPPSDPLEVKQLH